MTTIMMIPMIIKREPLLIVKVEGFEEAEGFDEVDGEGNGMEAIGEL